MPDPLTLIYTSQQIHAADEGMRPVCGSRAKVTGYHCRADGEVLIAKDERAKLCQTCMELCGLFVEERDA